MESSVHKNIRKGQDHQGNIRRTSGLKACLHILTSSSGLTMLTLSWTTGDSAPFYPGDQSMKWSGTTEGPPLCWNKAQIFRELWASHWFPQKRRSLFISCPATRGRKGVQDWFSAWFRSFCRTLSTKVSSSLLSQNLEHWWTSGFRLLTFSSEDLLFLDHLWDVSTARWSEGW